MTAWLLAAWLALAGPFGPDLPPLELSYLGIPGTPRADRPDGVDGMVPVPPGEALAIGWKGAFDFGGTDALTAALDAAPHARLVAFDSPGGRPLVAQAVASLLRSRHLDTTVVRVCASACTIAYLGGTLRTAGPRARFLFHLGTGPVLANLAATVVLQMERRWFVRAGASLSFAERALHAPNPDPYAAPLDELMAAGYVLRVLGPAPHRLGPATGLLAAVSRIEPQTGQALRAAADRVDRGSPAAVRAAVIADQRALLVVDRWLSRSADPAILRHADAVLAALAWFAGHDAMSCMRWQIGRDDQDRALAQLPAGLRRDVLDSGAAVLDAANAFPLPQDPDGDGALAQADATVRRSLAAEFGAHALADASSPEHGFDDPVRSCAVSTAYLRALRAAPGTALIRWALGAA